MAEKRSRSSNWSQNEKSLLKNLVAEYESVLNQRHSNEITNQKKREVWSYITNQINLLGVCRRSVDEIKTKWSNETRKLKKEFHKFNRESCRTGGGPPPTAPSAEDERLLSIFRHTASFSGVTGGFDVEPSTASGEGCVQQSLPAASASVIVDYDDTESEETEEEASNIETPIMTDKQRPTAQEKPKCSYTRQRRCKAKKIKVEDVYRKQMEVLTVELENKKLQTHKLKLQISLLEKLNNQQEDKSAQDILNAMLFE